MIDELRRFLLTHMYSVKWVYDGWRDNEFISEDDPQTDWNRTLMTKINQVSAMIFKDNRREGANVVIIPSNMREIISSLGEYYKPSGLGYQDYEEIGTLAGRYKIYVVPDLTEDAKVFVCNVRYSEDGILNILNLKNYSRVGVVKIEK
jgi:hypothetical protein